MKIDFTQALNDPMEGKPMEYGGHCPTCGDIKDPKPITLKFVAYKALTDMSRGDDQLTGEKKAEQGALAIVIATCNEPELKVEEVSMIKERIGKVWGPLIVKLAWDMLEKKGDATKKD